MSDPTTIVLRHTYQHFLQHLPIDWEKKSFAQLGAIVGGSTPSRDVPSFWRGSIPWVTPGEVSRETSKYIDDTNDHISASGLSGSGANLLPVGSLMVTTRATLGARAINAVPMATNQGFKSVIFRRSDDADYYFHVLDKVKPELVRRASGTTFLEISGTEFGDVVVPNPPAEEKRKIVQILDVLDTAIRETEAIIAKLKALKLGLLNDLLTRGIDANGELRSPQSEATRLYRPSPLGWIPSEWNVVRVGDEADIEHGFAFPGAGITSDAIGPALLVPGNFYREGGLYFTSENSKFFAGKYPRNTVLTNGDVLIVMTDLSPMTLILGRTVVLNEPFAVLHNQRIGKFRFRSHENWESAFFAAVMNQEVTRRKVIAEASGTTVRHTSPDRIKRCLVVRPSVTEQREASRRLCAVTVRQQAEETNALKLRRTKFGVMHDLLTGRVRVTSLLAKVTV